MDDLKELVAAELATPVDPRVSKLAAAIAAKHGAASRAVLFYGSCLREKQLDGLMLDFYLIVADYRAAYDRRWLARRQPLAPAQRVPLRKGRPDRQICGAERGGFPPAQWAGNAQRVGVGEVRAAVAAGVGGG